MTETAKLRHGRQHLQLHHMEESPSPTPTTLALQHRGGSEAVAREAVERWVQDDMRSTNAQVEWILRDALRRAKRAP